MLMGLIGEIEGMWAFAHMGDCGGGESEPIGNATKTVGFDENNNTFGSF